MTDTSRKRRITSAFVIVCVVGFRVRSLEDVLQVCRSSISLSAAGRLLFDRSRERKKIANDADRLRKYLARFDLEWGELRERFRQN